MKRVSFVDRVGAAMVSPRRALSHSDAAAGQGRAPTDVALLFFLGVVALHLAELATAGWLAVDGEGMAAVQLTISVVARDLSTPLLILFAAAILLTVFAGRKRSLGADLDLACVAFLPAVVVHVVAAGVLQLAPSLRSTAFDVAVSAVAYGWFAVGLALAHAQTRRRSEAP